MRYDAVLNVNGTDFPVEIEPHRHGVRQRPCPGRGSL